MTFKFLQFLSKNKSNVRLVEFSFRNFDPYPSKYCNLTIFLSESFFKKLFCVYEALRHHLKTQQPIRYFADSHVSLQIKASGTPVR